MLNKVLVVDDSSLIHQMYRLVLNRYNCTIADAMNGQEALELLALKLDVVLKREQFGQEALELLALQNDIELILLDINMPVMNGLQFLEKASPLGIISRIPVIIISTEGKE